MTQLTQTGAWKDLEVHFEEMAACHMRDLFEADPKRFAGMSLEAAGLLLDFSKNRITDKTLEKLVALGKAAGLPDRIEAMFRGDRINTTEDRSVLHVALRQGADAPLPVDDEDIMPGIHGVLEQMRSFAGKVRDGSWKGSGGERITDVVNVGIGGSDLGPHMVSEALAPYADAGISAHFVSNVDGTHITRTLAGLDPGTTLFIIASKSFTTPETMCNAYTARQWILSELGDDADISRHFVAVSTNEKAVRDFGIDPANMFQFWDWVGGRFSLWSAIGLPLVITMGMDRFAELLDGASSMDEHFRTAPLDQNMPVILGLLGIWYIDFFGAGAHAILPYEQHLHLLPAFLQQADMESNGKSTTLDGEPAPCNTGPVVFGEPGTNAQHAFLQLLHQGTSMVPADFIATCRSHNPLGEHHTMLLSNFLAQTEALMWGRNMDEAREEMQAEGLDADRIEALLPHRVFPGNRPSNSILMESLTPATLGALIALYEHKVMVQGTIWGINSFDQWGVELGKTLARRILSELDDTQPAGSHDSSTTGLIDWYRRHKA